MLPEMACPPLFDGRVQLKVAWPSPATTESAWGGAGGPTGVMLIGAEGADVPKELMAVAVIEDTEPLVSPVMVQDTSTSSESTESVAVHEWPWPSVARYEVTGLPPEETFWMKTVTDRSPTVDVSNLGGSDTVAPILKPPTFRGRPSPADVSASTANAPKVPGVRPVTV